jgi:malate dehydrogenase (oxaloacetate-decarboxylating)
MKGADIFLGISGPGLVTKEMVRSMAPDPIIFAMANPTPEIFPEEAKEAGASVIATGRSDYPNQINNCLGFPGIFRGALDVRATCVNEAMKIAAAKALAELVKDDELTPEYIIPAALDPRVVPAVAEGVARAAKESGVTR